MNPNDDCDDTRDNNGVQKPMKEWVKKINLVHKIFQIFFVRIFFGGEMPLCLFAVILHQGWVQGSVLDIYWFTKGAGSNIHWPCTWLHTFFGISVWTASLEIHYWQVQIACGLLKFKTAASTRVNKTKQHTLWQLGVNSAAGMACRNILKLAM